MPFGPCYSVRSMEWSQALVMLILEVAALSVPLLWSGVSKGDDYLTWVVLWFLWMGLYKKVYIRRWPFWAEMLSIVQASLLFGFVANATGELPLAHKVTGTFQLAAVITVATLLARLFSRVILSWLGLWKKPSLVFGSGENALKAYEGLQSEPWMGLQLVAFVDLHTDCQHHAFPPGIPCIAWSLTAGAQNWSSLLPYQCVIALESSEHCLRDHLLRCLTQHKIPDVHVIPALSGIPLFGARVTHFFSHNVLSLSLSNNLTNPGLSLIKRVFDIFAASLAIVLLAPVMVWIAWRVWREDGAPVVFSQRRMGRGGRTFKFYKFRSMVKNAEQVIQHWEENNTPEWQAYVANNFKLSDDPRLLSVGHLIRKTSMDELPQLFNVLLGDMSLVGPRPLMLRELPEYGEELVLYGLVRPGITGLWQVSGRSATTFADRIAFDGWYIKNWSLWGDIAILFKTVRVVFSRIGAY